MTRDGVEVALSAKEFDLLAYFLRHPGNVLSREQILSAVWGYSHDPGTNIVEVYVSYLRRKLRRPARRRRSSRCARSATGSRRAVRSGSPGAARLRPRSLRWRLTLAVGAVLVLAFVATFVVVYRETDSRLRAQDRPATCARRRSAFSRRRLAGRRRARARSPPRAARLCRRAAVLGLLAAALRGRSASTIATNEPEVLGLGARPTATTRRPRRTSRRARARSLQRGRPGSATQQRARRRRAAPARRAVPRRGGVIATDRRRRAARAGRRRARRDPRAASRSAARSRSRRRCCVGFLLAAGFARPLRRMARIAARVDAGDLSPRIEHRGPRNETRILADAFDHMLDRLEEAFARQQAFVSDASHELRTPLTAIRGQLEVLARSEHPDAAEVRRVAAARRRPRSTA